MKNSIILETPTKKQLADTNWAYGSFDKKIDKIMSNIDFLEKEYSKTDPNKAKILKEYYEIIDFKVKQTYSTMMDLLDLVHNTGSRHYRKFHGPFRKELGDGLFEEIKREVTYSLESFLTQLKSLIDFVIKFTFDYCSSNVQLRNVPDSLGSLFIIKKRKLVNNYSNSWNVIKTSHLFTGIINERRSLFEIQNYRDYIVHHGFIDTVIAALENPQNVSFTYHIPSVHWKRGSLTFDNKQEIDLIQFVKEKFYLVLSIVVEITEKMFDKSIKQKYLTQLKQFPNKDVLAILKMLTNTGLFFNRFIQTKQDLEKFLKSYNINVEELVIDSKETLDFNRGLRKKDPKFVHYQDRVNYKPLKGLVIYKEKTIMDGPLGRKEYGWYYHIRKDVLSKEEYSKITNSENILRCLQGCNLVYATPENPNHFGELKEDLMNLIHKFDNLNHIKWGMIQYTEFHHLGIIRPEVAAELTKFHTTDYDSYMKKLESDRSRGLEEYRKWKNDRYAGHKLPIHDENRNKIGQITIDDFRIEEKLGFENWVKNKFSITANNGTKIIRAITIPAGKDVQKELTKVISTYKKFFKRKPHNFIDYEFQQVRKYKKMYKNDIEVIKKEMKKTIRKYGFLKPVLKLMNYDTYAEINFDIVNAKNWTP